MHSWLITVSVADCLETHLTQDSFHDSISVETLCTQIESEAISDAKRRSTIVDFSDCGITRRCNYSRLYFSGLRVKHSDFSICDSPHPGWPKPVTIPEIIDQIHEVILEDCRISAKSITEKQGTSCGWVGSIIHEDLDVRKLSANWVPKCLTSVVPVTEQLFEFFQLCTIQMISCHD